MCQIWFDNVNIIYFKSIFVLCMFDVKGPRFFGISKIFASKKVSLILINVYVYYLLYYIDACYVY